MRVQTVLILITVSYAVQGLSLVDSNAYGSQLSKRHGGGNSALEHIDEAEILQHHDENPISYYQYDFEGAVLDTPADHNRSSINATAAATVDEPPKTRRHGGLMIFHGLSMTINYLMVLPVLIVLNVNSHRLRWLCRLVFWALNLLGWSAARAYRRSTPNLYVGSTHGLMGNVLLLLSAVVSLVDIAPRWDTIYHKLSSFRLNQRFRFPKRWMSVSVNLPLFWRPQTDSDTRYLPVSHSSELLAHDDGFSTSKPLDMWSQHLTMEPEEVDMHPSTSSSGQHSPSHIMGHSTSYLGHSAHAFHHSSGSRPRHSKAFSLSSDNATLHDDHHPYIVSKPAKTFTSRLLSIFNLSMAILTRTLVVYGWAQVMSGLTIYVGFGRAQYINGILAHFIKGSIFFWYGVMTFARYLGAWSRWGWAWNTPIPTRSDSSNQAVWSASFVESLIIFLYGFTQQFMERFGKHAGDPYSAKDIEHISIAVMFWGGGLVGMAVESPTLRGWLMGDGSIDMEVEEEEKRVHPPTSPIKSNVHHYIPPSPQQSNSSTDFGTKALSSSSSSSNDTGKKVSNPLPAFVIGVTGIAMSAHHQTYAFQVQIHALWGYLLLGFAICRCLTCFFEWVKPVSPSSPSPASSTVVIYTPPTHPPSELIGSVFLGAGGIAFICSDEQITFWAMRTHKDDVMMFLNLAIAFTCVAYVWTTIVLIVAGRTARNKHMDMNGRMGSSNAAMGL
ncbi:hypothetical protein FRC19_004631 [Serendipita sp. 401]|nr:hypothetical protein FRC19_004631 [Serendipita sp. 401]